MEGRPGDETAGPKVGWRSSLGRLGPAPAGGRRQAGSDDDVVRI